MSDWRFENEPADELDLDDDSESLHPEDEPESLDAEDPGPSDAHERNDPLGWPKFPDGLSAQPPDELAERPPLAAARRRFPRVAAPVAIAVVVVVLLGGCLRACAGRHADVGSSPRANGAGRRIQRRRVRRVQSVARLRERARESVRLSRASGRPALAPAVPLDVEPVPEARSSAAFATPPGPPASVRARLEFGFER
ncbi:MAG: hypothetical protein ACTHM1_00070 [Solirubrobacteraceae bacterium]